jgi:RNA polymerase sigma-70 factor (ECF subfamily)
MITRVLLRGLAAVPTATGAAVPGDHAKAVDESDAAAFQTVRPRLFGIAYRILGGAAEADDVVQDTWLRWQRTDRSEVQDATAFLATTTTRLAINVTQSARARREMYLGPRLPEPVDAGADPTLRVERGQSLELAVHMLVEKLSPTERAAYLLREAFDYPYRQISAVLALSEPHARQLVTRARSHLRSERRRPVGATEQQRLLEAFVAAAQTGDLETLEQLLTADVVTHSDGGGIVHPVRIPVVAGPRATRPVGVAA